MYCEFAKMAEIANVHQRLEAEAAKKRVKEAKDAEKKKKKAEEDENANGVHISLYASIKGKADFITVILFISTMCSS
jgi:hypothetical protein